MSEMVERVARAIYEKRNGHGCKPWSIQTKAHKQPYMDDASAAIEAMREPTAEMAIAGSGVWLGHPMTEVAAEDWRKMIDAAL